MVSYYKYGELHFDELNLPESFREDYFTSAHYLMKEHVEIVKKGLSYFPRADYVSVRKLYQTNYETDVVVVEFFKELL